MNNSPAPSLDAVPAHALWVELCTRITTQQLHYRSGEEETAAFSVASVFKSVRDLLNKHPEAQVFRHVAVTMLNNIIRPYTARWHGWMTDDKSQPDTLRFRDEQVRRTFRKELQELQAKLGPYVQMLEKLAHAHASAWAKGVGETMKLAFGGELAKRLHDDKSSSPLTARMGVDLEAGIGTQVEIVNVGSVAEINRFEHWLITRRRAMWADQPIPDENMPPANQVPVKNATGLALSGGGIRSATFCLGIVQVLVSKGLVPQFDYLSTVSGGGYFGSFLSCALGTRQPGDTAPTTRDSAEWKIKDVFIRQEEQSRQKGIESGLVRHLRNNSKYLLHGGFLGRMRIIGLLPSGLAWNLMIMLPIPLFAALLAYAVGGWLWGDSISGGSSIFPAFPAAPAGQALKWSAIVFGAGWFVLPLVRLLAHGQPPKSKGALWQTVWEKGTLWLGLATAVASLIFVVPALFHGYEWLRAALAQGKLFDLGAGGLTDLLPASLTGLASAALAVISAWLAPKWPRLRALVVKLFILTGPLLLLFVFLLVVNRMGLDRRDAIRWEPGWILWVTVGLAAWGWLCVNINTLAPHQYYRNRLCECYLARRISAEEGKKRPILRKLSGEEAQGKTEVLKQVKLTELCTDLSAPYHLLNMTINAPTSRNKNLRGRGGDFFVASRHFYGSPLTGYAKTEELERIDPHFDLGTAMAVSGAAASTSMGWQSLPHFRFLMTLFNVRLGYWLRNPRKPVPHRLFSVVGPWYLFREMLGRMDENCRYVNLSDGGHIENLAVYELLRRRCKFIVCVDGGSDAKMECSDLMRLQRYAEIDLGIGMHFDTSDLQIGSNDLSRSHSILVKIDYQPETAPGTQLGWMLYLKLAMTGVEPAYVKDYRRENPDFPHQSTGDQIYDEAQFEAYRALGECAMEGMFRDEIVGAQSPRSVRVWFQHLANNLLPDNDPAF